MTAEEPARPQFQGGRASKTVANIAPCATFLLFPFVVNTGDGAFDTGIAIANTGADPPQWGTTTAQSGDGTLWFFRSSSATDPSPVTIATNLAPGDMATFVVSSGLGSPFTGYVIAVCNFSFAHGFAFINSPTPGTGGAFSEAYVAVTLNSPRLGVPSPLIEFTSH